MTDQQAIINDIRHCYGIGLDGAPEHQRAIAELRANLNRAIEELARDLYSRETHFVLELIQNAEDNEYDDPNPFIRFRVDSGGILVQNNERGFREENVRALCRVGKSTKTKARGYIGEKGIGFKSVFRVSDAPCIVSNGFKFRLRSKGDGDELRFILPEWIEHVPPAVDPALTNIVLPLNDRAGDEVSKLDQIDPGLLLFLKKLKVIEVDNTSEGTRYRVSKHPLEDGFLEIEHPEGRDRWKLVARPVAVPEALQEEKRQGVQESELVLAFPVQQDNAADFAEERPLYAFLPVERTYGFRFVIQADFLQPASREDIHKNSEWNEWLRDEIPTVFLDAVETFKTPKNLRHTFYGYIPLASEVTDPFFSSVVHDIEVRVVDTLQATYALEGICVS